MTLDEANEALVPFRDRNPLSSVSQDGEEIIIEKVWNDESLYLDVPVRPERLFEALNNLLFPERFTAVWHSDTKDFEIIYTAFPLRLHQKEMNGRRFSFSFRGKTYPCEFGRSSDRLLTVAGVAVFSGPSTTEHRNLQSFKYYSDNPNTLGWSPFSFWIREFDWDEELAVALARHLNFYMTYYDTFSPKIELHAPKQETRYAARERFVTGAFPSDIRAEDLNSNLLHFWVASRGGDVFRRFLYCYQILEFSSFYFIEDNVKRAVKRVLTTPHLKDEMDSLIIKIIDQVQESKIWEGNKMEALLKEVNHEVVWKEVEKNKEYFSKPATFDGGFVLKPLTHEKVTQDAFKHDWHTKFAHTIRPIRNALSHGKDSSMAAVIAPTHENLTQLQPWASLISVVAGEVVVYQDSVM